MHDVQFQIETNMTAQAMTQRVPEILKSKQGKCHFYVSRSCSFGMQKRQQKQIDAKMVITGKKSLIFHLDLLLFTSILVQLSGESDSIFPGQTLSGNHTLSSKGGTFELGFFTPPGNPHNHYFGIWYKGLPLPEKTVVWVANRDHPVSDPYSSSLGFGKEGGLVLHTSSGIIVWSTNFTSITPLHNSTVGVLGDDGNFIIREISNSSALLWKSFEHPTDTWLPGAKLGHDNLTGVNTTLTSWKDKSNPEPGFFSADVVDKSSLVLRNRSSEEVVSYYSIYTRLISTDNYIQYSTVPNSGFVRYVLDVSGKLKQFLWWKDFKRWNLVSTQPQNGCDNLCGNFAICDQKSVPPCVCMPGYEPNIPQDWDIGLYGFGGCIKRSFSQCINGQKDKFFFIPNVSYPQSPETFTANNSRECQLACLSNCSCTAYAYDSSICLIWKGPIENIQKYPSDEQIGGNIYVRDTTSSAKESGEKRATFIVVVVVVVAVLVLLAAIGILLRFMRKKVFGGSSEAVSHTLMQFKYRDLQRATKNFTQKLGEGGFSTVYKGELPNSAFIAVKKLKDQMQDKKQLRAELNTVGLIQHRNLVHLRGFCLKDSKRFIVYDYMPNGSLESYLSNKGSDILDWGRRYKIALGTAKGLAYLHENCRDFIIHCDIKPENILLDDEYEPKVSDFGLAKLLSRNFNQVITTFRGTRGYLAPEWFSGEAITAKVDVFSYGQVLFEIISGRRNMDMLNNELCNYFPALVCTALNNGADVLKLVDPKLEGNVNVEEVTRACKVASWCIQDSAKDRPTMAQVVQILEGVIGVGVPPIPRFFQSIAVASLNASDIKRSEASCTSSSERASFNYQTTVSSSKSNLSITCNS